MRHPGRIALSFLALLGALPSAATGQPTGALERFVPAPAGDALFGVPSPAVGGHLVPRATAIFDYAYQPLSIESGGVRQVIVSQQAFVHLGASLALWDRLLVSFDLPFAVVQGGNSPSIAGAGTYASPSGADVGDLRLGARARLYGEYWDPFQIAIGGYLFLPSAPGGTYAGDGSVRGVPQILLGGRIQRFLWNANLGTTIRASAHPSTFDLGLGAAVVLGKDLLQLGPELTLSAAYTSDSSLSTPTANVTVATQTAAELLFGAKLRFLKFLVFGAAVGPGLTNAYGTPKYFVVGSLSYAPLPAAADEDHDGIPDAEDACPNGGIRGQRSDDPTQNGCVYDTDADGIPDSEDACPAKKGPPSKDRKRNGCPAEMHGIDILESGH